MFTSLYLSSKCTLTIKQKTENLNGTDPILDISEFRAYQFFFTKKKKKFNSGTQTQLGNTIMFQTLNDKKKEI